MIVRADQGIGNHTETTERKKPLSIQLAEGVEGAYHWFINPLAKYADGVGKRAKQEFTGESAYQPQKNVSKNSSPKENLDFNDNEELSGDSKKIIIIASLVAMIFLLK